jgi:hypothetical protein
MAQLSRWSYPCDVDWAAPQQFTTSPKTPARRLAQVVDPMRRIFSISAKVFSNAADFYSVKVLGNPSDC